MTLYDQIGVGYDTTRRADPSIVNRLLALLDVPAGSRCLDVACGTGNYTAALGGAGLQMTGLDVSRQTVNAIETEKYDPSLPLAFKVAKVFRLPIEKIFFPAE